MSNHKIHTISLRILIKDETIPAYTITFYDNSVLGLQKESDKYKKIQIDLQKWLNIFQAMLKETKPKDAYVIESNPTATSEQASVQNTGEPLYSENKIIKMKLIATLKQVIQQKQQPTFTNTSIKTNQQQQRSSNFDEILRKNRKILHGKKDD